MTRLYPYSFFFCYNCYIHTYRGVFPAPHAGFAALQIRYRSVTGNSLQSVNVLLLQNALGNCNAFCNATLRIP